MRVPRILVDLTPLRESRDFRILWLSQLASTGGRQIVVVAVPYQVYVMTHSSLAVGLVGLFQVLPIIGVGLYGGALVDRFDRRRLQLIGRSVVAAASAALALAAFALPGSLWLIYLVVAISAGASTLDQASRSATVPRLVSASLLPSAMSLSQGLFQAASIVGPALAGLIILRAGVGWAYLVDVACFVPAVALVLRLTPQPPMADHVVEVGWRAPIESWRFVRRNPLLLGLFTADLVAMIFGMPTAVFPQLALDTFRIGPGGLGLLYAAPAAGALAGSIFSGWVGNVERQGRAVLLAIAAWGVAIAGFGLAGNRLWIGLPLLAAAGAADLVSALFRGTILQLSVPDSLRGRMSAVHLMVVTTGPRLGDLEAGAVASAFGAVFSVVSGGLACVAGVALLSRLVPVIRQQRVTPA
ncbi:MAG: MFS transporter [Candidatus Dormibacteraeota bacterium]|nr:MFS transporter [Candidatus Dormibacteraeota bacterium]